MMIVSRIVLVFILGGDIGQWTFGRVRLIILITMKTFLKFFGIFFVLFTLVITPAFKAIADYNPFAGIINIEEDMDSVLVDPNSPFFSAFKDTKRVNILCVGVNKDMTDTIMLVSFDKKNKHADIISIPRDSYYDREGYTGASEKINAIYASEGILKLAYAVSDILQGIPINYYVIIDYEDVKAVVDAMGGVPMNIEKAMKYKDPYDDPPLVIDIPAGEQILDGEHAVQFLRYRKGYRTGDLGRIEAQQTFVKSAIKQALTNDLTKVVKTAFQTVESDITIGTATSLGLNAADMTSENFETYTCPNTEATIYGLSFVKLDDQGIQDMLLQIYNIGTTTDSAIQTDAESTNNN